MVPPRQTIWTSYRPIGQSALTPRGDTGCRAAPEVEGRLVGYVAGEDSELVESCSDDPVQVAAAKVLGARCKEARRSSLVPIRHAGSMLLRSGWLGYTRVSNSGYRPKGTRALPQARSEAGQSGRLDGSGHAESGAGGVLLGHRW